VAVNSTQRMEADTASATLFYCSYNTGRWTKSKNIVVLKILPSYSIFSISNVSSLSLFKSLFIKPNHCSYLFSLKNVKFLNYFLKIPSIILPFLFIMSLPKNVYPLHRIVSFSIRIQLSATKFRIHFKIFFHKLLFYIVVEFTWSPITSHL
jgi:hypothetical protein